MYNPSPGPTKHWKESIPPKRTDQRLLGFPWLISLNYHLFIYLFIYLLALNSLSYDLRWLIRKFQDVNALELVRNVKKRTFEHVRPTQTQINLHTRSPIRVFVILLRKLTIIGYSKCVQWRFWSDFTNAHADLNLRCAQMSKGTFFDVVAQLVPRLPQISYWIVALNALPD